MPEYKLIYFNAQGRAELTRWIFTQGEIEFTDERIEIEEWPERKPDIPGGKLPILMVDERPLVQSMAIARFAAKEAGLIPEDNLDAAYCDALTDTFSETMSQLGSMMYGAADDDERQRLYEEEFYPNLMEPLLKKLNGRMGDREWFITDDMTWADLAIARSLCQIQQKHPEVLEPFPAVAAHVEKICELPAIKDWIENRPETQY